VSAGAVLRAALSGITRRWVQTAVLVLVPAAASAAALLGLTLATDANAQFLGAFASQHGADLAVTIDSGKVTSAELNRTRHLPDVTSAAGPYDETAVYLAGMTHTPGSIPMVPANPALSGVPDIALAVVGRSSPAGPLDDITISQGHWATRPGEIVLSVKAPYRSQRIGSKVTVTSAPGRPQLTVVGYGSTVAGDEEAWVAPGETAALRAKGAPAQVEMLYTFASASTTAQISADLAGLRAALPAGAVADSISWLGLDGAVATTSAINTPYVVAFAIIAVVLAVLIVANLASAVVTAAYRRIGVLKSLGFTPAQVACVYLVQIGIPAVIGAIAGTVLGDRWVLPVLNGGPFKAQPVPLWINISAPAGMLVLAAVATLVPALRAGRLSAVQAIAAGQAPRAGRGYLAHRLAATLRLPRSVSIGLAAPFSRPARSAVTLAAITSGLAAVVLAIGLNTSLANARADSALFGQSIRIGAGVPQLPSGGPGGRAGPFTRPLTQSQQRTIRAALRSQPGTLLYAPAGSVQATVPGVGSAVSVTAYNGNVSRLGWDLTAGHWYTGPGQVVVNTARASPAGLTAGHGVFNAAKANTARLTVGQTIGMTVGGKTFSARIVGKVYAPPRALWGTLFTSWQTLSGARGLAADYYEVGLAPGTNQQRYQDALSRTLGPSFTNTAISFGVNGEIGTYAAVDTSLIRLLTILVAVLAGLGVLSCVLILARDRVHDLGIFKAIGMTPPQTITMVICWVITPGIAAAIIALPAGIALHNTVIHAINKDQSASVRAALLSTLVHVYNPGEFALLALAALAVALVGALAPATWAALSKTTTPLHAE
jgi:putative ABC transport system permease protein